MSPTLRPTLMFWHVAGSLLTRSSGRSEFIEDADVAPLHALLCRELLAAGKRRDEPAVAHLRTLEEQLRLAIEARNLYRRQARMAA